MSKFDQERFAVIADVHSNSEALSAVLTDIEALGVQCIVNLGDHVSGPLAPRETANAMLAADTINIKGNHDRWLCENTRDEMCSIDKVAFDQMEQSHLDWLAAMPGTLQLSAEVFACHGTPTDDLVYWMEHVQPDGSVVLQSLPEIARHTQDHDSTLFLCGHTHVPRRIDLPDGKVILNPGSVGCPAYMSDAPFDHKIETGTSAACYAIVEQTKDGWASAMRHVPYDPSRMIALAHAADHPQWEPRLAKGRVS